MDYDNLNRDAQALSTLTGMNSRESLQALVSCINCFSNEYIDSTQVVDKLRQVDSNFSVSARELSESLMRAGSSAEKAQVNFDDLTSLVTMASHKTGRDGKTIGNAVKVIIERLYRPYTVQLLSEEGVHVFKGDGATRPLLDILQDLSAVLDNIPDLKRNTIAEAIGGVYQMNVLRVIVKDLKDPTSVYQQVRDSLNNQDGTTR